MPLCPACKSHLELHGHRCRKLYVAEEVFLIMKELRGTNTFRWKDWKRAWEAVSLRWKYAGFMSAGIALKTQVEAGTIMRLSRGLYIFTSMRLGPSHPLYAPENFRPYRDTYSRW